MTYVVVPKADTAYFEQRYQLEDPGSEIQRNYVFKVGGYRFPGILYRIQGAPKEMFWGEEICGRTSLDERTVVTLVARPLGAHQSVDVSSVILGTSAFFADAYADLADEMFREVEVLARFACCRVELVISDGQIIIPPARSKQGLKVVLGTSPSGYKDTRRVSKLFEVPLCEPGYEISVPGPARDAGVIVKNTHGEEVAQIVGRTIYLLLPAAKEVKVPLSRNGGAVFSKALILAWNAYCAQRSLPEPKYITSAEQFEEVVFRPEHDLVTFQGMVKGIDRKILDAQQSLRDAMADKRWALTLIDGLNHLQRLDYTAVWARLTTSPYFSHVSQSSDDRVHYFTKPLTMSGDDGKERFLGRFGLRLSIEGSVTVWSLDHPHFAGIPHPHINEFGGICLGNVTESIMHLLLEYREADAALLVMKLLAEGYDAKTTLHRIEEWPTTEKVQ